MLPLPDRALPGGLRLLEPVGETAVGPLYRGRYLDSAAEVGVVLLRVAGCGEPDGDWVREYFRRAARVRHPNVAAVREVGESAEGLTYVVFELCQGERLSEALAARRAFSLPEAADLVLQAAAGLQAMRKEGVAHGGISPATILVTRGASGRPLVKLIGLAVVQQGNGEEGPRGPLGRSPDEQEEVAGLGAVLHQLLTRAAPRAAADQASPIPEAARPIVSKALATSRAERFRTIAELSRALSPLAWGGRRARGRAPRVRAAFVVGTAISLAVLSLLGSARRSGTGAPPRHPADVGAAVLSARVPEPVESRSVSPASAPAPGPAPRYVSPFRRRHPWVAEPGGRFYYRSTCPTGLELPEPLYFASEADARAEGLVPSRVPGCS